MLGTEPILRRSSRYHTRAASPPPRSATPITAENDTLEVPVTQILRRFLSETGAHAFQVRYAPTHNITQAAINARTQTDVPLATRNSRLKNISGDHPFVLESSVPDPENPDNFIATWQDGPELRKSLCLPDGKPGPLLAEYESTPTAQHAQNIPILPTGSTPNTRDSALASADRRHWRFALDAEFNQLIEADTWDLVLRSQARNVISGKWVLKIKKDSLGEISRYKARWVARGFTQREGVDFNDIFAPVIRYSSIRLLLSLAARHNTELYGIDVSNAFARADVDEDLFVDQPHGYEQKGPNGEHLVCKLKKGLYGTKQAARLWHHTFRRHLLADGWIPYESDPCLFSRRTERYGLEFLGTYVDDSLHLCQSKAAHDALIEYCTKAFPTNSSGELDWILNCKITRDRKNRALWIDQSLSAQEFLRKWDISPSNTSPSTPMDPEWKYGDVDQFPPIKDESIITEYRSKVSSLSYLVQVTRPDLAFSVNSLARWMHAPNANCMSALSRLCSYLASHFDIGLRYSSSPTKPVRLYSFADASWNNSDCDKAKSTSGILTFYGNDLIDWASSIQKITALSPAEAEHNAAFDSARTLTYTRMLLDELGYPETTASTIYEDNTACIAQSKNPVNFKRSRHVNLRFHYLRELTETREVECSYISTHEQLADALTKPLPGPQFNKLCSHFVHRCPRAS